MTRLRATQRPGSCGLRVSKGPLQILSKDRALGEKRGSSEPHLGRELGDYWGAWLVEQSSSPLRKGDAILTRAFITLPKLCPLPQPCGAPPG